MADESKRSSMGYWALVAALLGFGLLSLFTIGAGLLLMGITLALLAPFRDRPSVFWPLLLLVVGFIVGYALVAPFSCTQEAITDFEQGLTVESDVVCRSLTGITYTGSEDPSVLPGLVAGVVVAVLSATGAWIVVGRREAALE